MTPAAPGSMPSWYATKHKSGDVVPTWNYVAIHAYDTPRFDDPSGPSPC